jgi:hypothetical protein
MKINYIKYYFEIFSFNGFDQTTAHHHHHLHLIIKRGHCYRMYLQIFTVFGYLIHSPYKKCKASNIT